ncbi:hypothetical protein CHS0354_039135 [Potamilus streckersoni]|uniref:Uncharacterized protein n=1 Tax=Potamilus streckersoni TaxID=2493646 RepID=A0AAE0WA54_9BIVA|nr:hypothetical protein CHS0354_039135 [Potamilus streckersoni]
MIFTLIRAFRIAAAHRIKIEYECLHDDVGLSDCCGFLTLTAEYEDLHGDTIFSDSCELFQNTKAEYEGLHDDIGSFDCCGYLRLTNEYEDLHDDTVFPDYWGLFHNTNRRGNKRTQMMSTTMARPVVLNSTDNHALL